jgi:hypothetical protein
MNSNWGCYIVLTAHARQCRVVGCAFFFSTSHTQPGSNLTCATHARFIDVGLKVRETSRKTSTVSSASLCVGFAPYYKSMRQRPTARSWARKQAEVSPISDILLQFTISFSVMQLNGSSTEYRPAYRFMPSAHRNTYMTCLGPVLSLKLQKEKLRSPPEHVYTW